MGAIGIALSLGIAALWFVSMWRTRSTRIGARSIAAMLAAYPPALRARMVDEHRRWRAANPADALTLAKLQDWARSAQYAIEREQPPRADARAAALRQDRAFGP